jgi:hypothetical protein
MLGIFICDEVDANKVKKHKVRSRGRMSVLISTSWAFGPTGLLTQLPDQGAHPLGLRAPSPSTI